MDEFHTDLYLPLKLDEKPSRKSNKALNYKISLITLGGTSLFHIVKLLQLVE